MLPDWSPEVPNWTKEELDLLPSEKISVEDVTLDTIVEKSESFPVEFPVDTNRCKNLKHTISEEILERYANSAYPIVHENILHFYAQFILHKRQFGNPIEKSLYEKINLLEFVDRLLTKRAVSFISRRDNYCLLSGKKGHSTWETIGTESEKEPLSLKNCLQYEEVKLSAFLSVSSYTHFMNVGDRKNVAVYSQDRSNIQEEGVIIGIIGPRLIKDNVMDYQELVISEGQNTPKNGYGNAVKKPTIHQLFAKLYQEDCREYKDVVVDMDKIPGNPKYTLLKNGQVLDNFAYYKRLVFTMDTLFLEANRRALEKGTCAYVHVVGIGLGVWKKTEYQNKLFMDTCASRLKLLGSNLHNISDICFAYIAHDSCGQYKHGQKIPIEGHPQNGIRILLSKREPHEKLEDAGKLLVVSYAWDGNALPGNEYWSKKLGSSGDSAAASSTQIAELHNPFINPRVVSKNLRVATQNNGIVDMEEYVRFIRDKRTH